MNVLEIVLLVLGLVSFVLSFVISEKKEDGNEKDSRESIHQIIEEETEDARGKIQNMVDETISYSIEKTERAMDRLSNEKMMALGEYSDKILSQISTNHQETVFMYDMLSKSKEELMPMLARAKQDTKNANNIAEEAMNTSQKALDYAMQAQEAANGAASSAVIAEEKMITARKSIQDIKPKQRNRKRDGGETLAEKSESLKGSIKNTIKEKIAEERDDSGNVQEKDSIKKQLSEGLSSSTKKEPDNNIVSIKEAAVEATEKKKNGINNKDEYATKIEKDNNNAEILRLHKKGMADVTIARELGLGIGEVQLVIDLFEKKKK